MDRSDLLLLFESAHLLVCTANHEGQFEWLGEGWEQTLGYTKEELLGRPFVDFVHPDDRAATFEAMGDLDEGREVVNFVNRYRASDGSWRWLRWDAGTREGLIYAAARDVTDAQARDQRSAEQSRLLTLSERLAGIGTWRLDLLQDSLHWSEGVYRIHGLDPATFTPTLERAIEAYHPEDRDRVAELVSRAIEEQEAFAFELRLNRSDGNLREVVAIGDVELHPITREVSAVFGIFQDVTDSRALERRVRESERLDSLATLASGIAHEINNPLAYVSGNLDLAFEAVLDDQESRGENACNQAMIELLADAQVGVQQVSRIVKELKSFMRRPEDSTRKVVGLDTVLSTAVSMTRARLRSRTHFTYECEELQPVLGSDAELIQVFVNLIANAVDAVRGLDASLARIQLSAFQDDQGWAVVEVEDNGVGVPEDQRSTIFEPFFTTKGVTGGTGLGLHVTRSIVQAHGGEVELLPRRDGATVFRVRLPTVECPDGRCPEERADSEAPTEDVRPRLLIVEDDVRVATMMRRVLDKVARIDVEHDPAHALRRVRRGTTYDAVVSDVSMPGMTGWELAEQLAVQLPDVRSRLLMVTGNADKERPAWSAAVPVLEKPFAPNELREAVARLFVVGDEAAPA